MGCEALGITNADRVRNMSVEELAMVIMCPREMGAHIDQCVGVSCVECCAKWLQQTAEEVPDNG